MADEGNALGRVNPGDALNFPAQTFNIFCDTAEEVARMKGRQFADRQPGRGINTGIVTVRNDSGGDLLRFAVLGIGAPIIDNSDNLAEFQNRVTFKGQLPDIDLHRGRFVILLEPLADGAIGKAVVSGVCQVLVNVSDAAHTFADVIDGDATTLASGWSGAEILWKETGTGDDKCAIVRLGPPTPELLYFELKDDLLAGNTGTQYADAYLVADSGGSFIRDTSITFRVYNNGDNIFRGRGSDSSPINEGSRGYARWSPTHGRWEVVWMGPVAGLVKFVLTSNLAHDATSATATVVTYWRGGPLNQYSDGITVSNSCGGTGQEGHSGGIGHHGLAIFDPFTQAYIIIWMEPNDYDPVTLTVVSSATATGYYTRDVKLPRGSSYSGESWHAY